MGKVEPPSLKWLKDLASIEADLEAKTYPHQKAMAEGLGLDRAVIHHLTKIGPCLNTEARDRIRQAAEAPGTDSPKESVHPKLGPQPEASDQGPYIFSYNKAKALEPLQGRVSDVFGAVRIILDRAILDRLKTVQIEVLVDHIIKGEPPEDFDHTPVKRRSSKGKSQKKTEDSEESKDDDDSEDGDEGGGEDDSDEGDDLPGGGGVDFTTKSTLANRGPQLVASAQRGSSKKDKGKGKRTKVLVTPPKTAKPLSETQKLLWDALLGVSVFKQVKAKVHKGESPSVWLLLLLVITQLVGWTHHYGWRLIKFCWKHFVKALGRLGETFPGLKKLVENLFSLAVVALVVWLGWKVWHHEIHPIEYLESKVSALWAGSHQEPAQPNLEPRPVVSTQAPPAEVTQAKFHPVKRKDTPVLRPQAEGQALGAPIPFSGIGEDKALLQAAMGTLPSDHCKVKPCPVTPDGSMNPLMAVNRLGDLAVESEYSLRVGQGGQKILSVTPSATGLTIATQGGLPLGGFLGDGSKFGFYWEDVQAIYCNELETPSKKIYFFVLKAANLNQPLVVECNNPNNLGHLVSAFEYFIKTAQGKTVPVTGMPYLSQGLVLGDEGKITAIWQNSPADDAALSFDDHLWSVSGNQRQTPAVMEAALTALPSGRQMIEIVTPKDWQAAAAKASREHNSQFEAKLTAYEILVP
jgi:hypothetical protein